MEIKKIDKNQEELDKTSNKIADMICNGEHVKDIENVVKESIKQMDNAKNGKSRIQTRIYISQSEYEAFKTVDGILRDFVEHDILWGGDTSEIIEEIAQGNIRPDCLYKNNNNDICISYVEDSDDGLGN